MLNPARARITANPDVAPKRGNFRIGDNRPTTSPPHVLLLPQHCHPAQSKIRCHPERVPPRRDESKDLHLPDVALKGHKFTRAENRSPIFREIKSAAKPRSNPRRESSSKTHPTFHANASTDRFPKANFAGLIQIWGNFRIDDHTAETAKRTLVGAGNAVWATIAV
jgi:hypothetical protein